MSIHSPMLLTTPVERYIMVREIDENGERLYVCDACGFAYKEKPWAEKCQDYCTKHNACSLEITSHAVQSRPLEDLR